MSRSQNVEQNDILVVELGAGCGIASIGLASLLNATL